MPPLDQPVWTRRLAAGLFLSSLTLLALELVLVRIFSVLMWYHFVSLVISLALLGLTVSGLVVFVAPRSFPPERTHTWLGRFSLLLSLAILADWAFFFALNRFPRLAYRILTPFHQVFYEPFGTTGEQSFSWDSVGPLAVVFVFSLLPFLFGGFVATLSIARYTNNISRVYFADLSGAGAGCVFTFALLTYLDPFRALGVLAAVAALAALLFLGREASLRWRLPAAAALVLAAGLAGAGGLLEMHVVRGRYEPEILWSRWNSFSRVAVYPLKSGQAEGSWGMSRRYRGELPPQLGMVVDDTGYSSITRNAAGDDLTWARSTLFALPYVIRPAAASLIIGPGGGKEVLVARAMGSPAIQAVEINPLMVQAVQGSFAEFSGSPYSLPGVRTVIDEGRTWLRRDHSRYDVIAATVVYGVLSPAAGAFTLTEDHLYTSEAFGDYLDHLKPGGLLAFSRFLYEKAILRMVATAREALERRGARIPGDHIFIASERGLATVIVNREPFTPEEVQALQARSRELGFTVLAAPGQQGDNLFQRLLREPDVKTFYTGLPYDVAPVTDDRPFYYYLVRPADFLLVMAGVAGPDFNDRALILIRNLMGLLIVFLLLFLALPLMLQKKAGSIGWTGALPALIFFASLGLGFVVVEITLLKRFILLLGKPVYSVAVILAAFLAAGGLGSLRARGGLGDRTFLRRRCAMIAGLLLFLTFLLPRLIEAALPLPLGARILVTVLIVAPAGYLMGQPFPLGIDLLRRSGGGLIPWVWSVNGGLSVLGSMLTLVLAINFGYTTTMLIGPVAYLAAAMTAKRL